MKGKTCLITGTASGMGRIAAKALAKKGANLILVDFDTENGILAKDEIIQDTGNQAVDQGGGGEEGDGGADEGLAWTSC